MTKVRSSINSMYAGWNGQNHYNLPQKRGGGEAYGKKTYLKVREGRELFLNMN